MFQVLNGPTYSKRERPPFWKNEKELRTSDRALEHAPLNDFPLIEDFEVRLEWFTKSPAFGYQVCFFSPARGYIASFPWWDHAEQDLMREGFTIPLGDFAKPFSDVDQSWELIIAAKSKLVYVLQGKFDHSPGRFHSWFKVRQDLYLAEWGRQFKPVGKRF